MKIVFMGGVILDVIAAFWHIKALIKYAKPK